MILARPNTETPQEEMDSSIRIPPFLRSYIEKKNHHLNTDYLLPQAEEGLPHFSLEQINRYEKKSITSLASEIDENQGVLRYILTTYPKRTISVQTGADLIDELRNVNEKYNILGGKDDIYAVGFGENYNPLYSVFKPLENDDGTTNYVEVATMMVEQVNEPTSPKDSLFRIQAATREPLPNNLIKEYTSPGQLETAVLNGRFDQQSAQYVALILRSRMSQALTAIEKEIPKIPNVPGNNTNSLDLLTIDQLVGAYKVVKDQLSQESGTAPFWELNDEVVKRLTSSDAFSSTDLEEKRTQILQLLQKEVDHNLLLVLIDRTNELVSKPLREILDTKISLDEWSSFFQSRVDEVTQLLMSLDKLGVSGMDFANDLMQATRKICFSELEEESNPKIRLIRNANVPSEDKVEKTFLRSKPDLIEATSRLLNEHHITNNLDYEGLLNLSSIALSLLKERIYGHGPAATLIEESDKKLEKVGGRLFLS